MIVVAEGARAEDGEMVTIDDRHDAFGHVRLGGIGEVLARRIAAETPYEARGGVGPSATRWTTESDRSHHGNDVWRASGGSGGGQRFGKMVSARGVAPACEFSLVDISACEGRSIS